MAKKIIILDRRDGTPAVFRVAYWFAVAAARQSFYASPGAVSAWKGASAPENAAIAAGQIFEDVDMNEVAPGASMAAIQAELQAVWTSKDTRFQASVAPQRYGSFWDGAAWTIVNI